MNTELNGYLADLKGKRVAVLGVGVSNTPVIKMLLRHGISVTARDKCDREELGGVADELESLGATLILGWDYLRDLREDVIFRTPGMRPDLYELEAARSRGSVITSEMEVFFEVCPCKIIGVTGSDGKTTTTTIIAELLKAAGHHVYLGGNIGKPLLADAMGMQPEDWAVVELSSFQLMTMPLSPDIAVVTNVAPNHLDVHKDMDEYVGTKKNIFLHQPPGGRVVLNASNDICMKFSYMTELPVTLFSGGKKLVNGYYYTGKTIMRVKDGETHEIIDGADIMLPGRHNIENYMAAFAATEGLVSVDTCRAVAKSFKGVEHRIELVRTLNGVRYYNDSIASSPSRTIAGLNSFDRKVILIAGGYDKNIPFDSLGPKVTEHVKTLILCGATARKIRAAVEGAPGYAKGAPDILEYNDFSEAVMAAHSAACEGDVVLLSPACASFDKFKNFAERGAAFKTIIYQLD